jgi:phosphonate metabolism protein PhnN/1,5-bisphosphokinase (PRPP-forming)
MSEQRQGTMIVVVGPSGAGKDSLIDFARQRLAGHENISFVRRFITRDADAGSEDHHAVSVAQFEDMRLAGKFAVHWGAHDLHYGIPTDTLDQLASGMTLIVNGSRAALPEFLKAYPAILVITVTADPAIIAERLKNRGRENDQSISKRLARSQQEWSIDCRHVVIDNGGALETAGTEFVKAILATAKSDIAQRAYTVSG